MEGSRRTHTLSVSQRSQPCLAPSESGRMRAAAMSCPHEPEWPLIGRPLMCGTKCGSALHPAGS
eukprot:850372-Alexandrium_andersonii.AAC.1